MFEQKNSASFEIFSEMLRTNLKSAIEPKRKNTLLLSLALTYAPWSWVVSAFTAPLLHENSVLTSLGFGGICYQKETQLKLTKLFYVFSKHATF